MNGIDVSYTRDIGRNVSDKQMAKQNGNTEKSFYELAMQASNATQKATEASGASAVASKGMTLEAYKQYISDEISKLPINPSQMNTTVHISDAGFEAMKNDPQYEKWVLDRLGAEFSYNDPWFNVCGGKYSVYNFGASIGEHTGQSWYPEYDNGNGTKLFDEKSKGSFWEKRVERHKENMLATQELYMKQAEINAKIEQENIFRVQAGLDEKLPYFAGVPASVLLGLLG